eukprot:4419315-Ditylum_brightwellii.AAC.1
MEQTTSSDMRNGLLLEAIYGTHLHHVLHHCCQHSKFHQQMIEDGKATALKMTTNVCTSAKPISFQIQSHSGPRSIACNKILCIIKKNLMKKCMKMFKNFLENEHSPVGVEPFYHIYIKKKKKRMVINCKKSATMYHFNKDNNR